MSDPLPAPSDPMGVPLDGHTVKRLEQLERLVGSSRYQGWAREPSGQFRIDVLHGDDVVGYRGDTLHVAIGLALRACSRTEVAP